MMESEIIRRGKVVSVDIMNVKSSGSMRIEMSLLARCCKQAVQEKQCLDDQSLLYAPKELLVDDNERIRRTVRKKRRGRFPFFRGDMKAPTALDELTVHPMLLLLMSKALNCDHPRLLDAYLTTIHGESDTIQRYAGGDASAADRKRVPTVVVLNLTLDAEIANQTVQYCRVEGASGLLSTRPSLRILYHSGTSMQYMPHGFIRYLEHAEAWIRSLNCGQRTALGFPSPSDEYWRDNSSLQQVALRYPGMKFDLYRTASVTSPIQQSIPAPPDGAVSTCDPNLTHRDSARWIFPERVLIDNNDMVVLSDQEIRQFRDNGYLFLEGIWPQRLIDDAAEAARELWPDKVGTSQSPDSPFQFPFAAGSRLRDITLYRHIWSVACQLLQVDRKDLRIMQSACFSKRGPPSEDAASDPKVGDPFVNGNQPMHQDFGSNTLLVPARSKYCWQEPEEVQGILYYNDHKGVEGGTAFVPGLSHTGADPVHKGWLPDNMENDPRPALYRAERKVAYSKGSILLFQLGTWHRGTPVAAGAVRRVQHLCFKRANATWVGGSAEFGQADGIFEGLPVP